MARPGGLNPHNSRPPPRTLTPAHSFAVNTNTLTPQPPHLWRIAQYTAALLGALLLWDASGLDLWVMQQIGTPSGFPLTGNYWLSKVLHTGARQASTVVFIAMWLLALLWPATGHAQLGTRKQRVWLLTGMTLSLILISGLKSVSTVSCPWDLSEFGGAASYVSHWRLGQVDGGGGRCFPGGHVSSAFAYLALLPSLLLAPLASTRTRARTALVAVVVIGMALGLTQTVRGAHYPSHTLWTAWLCWASAWLWFALGQWLHSKRQARHTSPSH